MEEVVYPLIHSNLNGSSDSFLVKLSLEELLRASPRIDHAKSAKTAKVGGQQISSIFPILDTLMVQGRTPKGFVI